MPHRKRSRKQIRAIKAKSRNGKFHETAAPIGNDEGPLGGSGGLTEERSVTSNTAIGTGTAFTHKEKHFIGGKHRITNTKGEGDRIL